MRTRRLVPIILLLALAGAIHAVPIVVHFRHASGKWLPLPCAYDDARGVISFTLDPKLIGSGSTTIVLGEQKGVALDDEVPPRVTGLKLDDHAVKVQPMVDLDWLPEQPKSLTIGVADEANRLDQSSLKLQLNGKPLQSGQYALEPAKDGKSLRLVLPMRALLGAQPPFLNTIDLRAMDIAPTQNSVNFSLRYRCLGEVTQDPTVLVDSVYPGYEDLNVLTDGKVMQPGVTTYGCTWASEEKPGDHWLVFAWPQEKTVSGVEVFWATFQGTFHAPQKLLVQTWDGKQWVTQKTLQDLKAERSTAIDLAPVKTARLRLLQPDGQGHPVRPNIMWITEVTVK